MTRLIDADALMNRMEARLADIYTEVGSRDGYADGFEEGMVAVEDAPTVDAEEVKHGRWKNITGGMIMLGDCSECNERQPIDLINFCRKCGAKMDGERRCKDD